MGHYRVKWDIDIYADEPLEAADIARQIQQDPENIASIFEVTRQGRTWTADTLERTVSRKEEPETLETKLLTALKLAFVVISQHYEDKGTCCCAKRIEIIKAALEDAKKAGH